MASTETVQFQATREFHRLLGSEAAKLNLSLSAYVQYLHTCRVRGKGAALRDLGVQGGFGNDPQ
jgi:hypothetical protein